MKFITIGCNSFRISDIKGFNSRESYTGDWSDRKNNTYFQLEVIIGGKEFFACREFQDPASSQEEMDKRLQKFHNKWLIEIDDKTEKKMI